MYIRKGDTVMVIRGKYKGRRGRVLEVYSKKERLLIEGVNMMKKHTRPNSRNQAGGIVERESPIHISNVTAYDESGKRPSRIVMKRLDDGSRIRVWKHSGEALD